MKARLGRGGHGGDNILSEDLGSLLTCKVLSAFKCLIMRQNKLLINQCQDEILLFIKVKWEPAFCLTRMGDLISFLLSRKTVRP